MYKIKHNVVDFSYAQSQLAADVIFKTGQVVNGDACRALEAKWCEVTGAEDAAMVSSGFSALRLALIALGIGQGDEVIIPGFSCTALYIATSSINAIPVLADIRPDDLTLDINSVKTKTTDKTKAIIVVHMFGAYADVDSLNQLGVPIVEDFAHSIFKQECKLSISSFWPTKLISSMGGGIVAGDKELIGTVREYSYYGDRKI